MLSQEIRTPSSICPYCGCMLDACCTIGHGSIAPKPGDWTICMDCSQVLFFTETLTVRKPLPGELQAYARRDPLIRARMAFMRQVAQVGNRRRGKWQH